MTYQEARLKAKLEGVRIRNCNFTPDEWFEWRDGALRCELGYNMSTWYRGEAWQDEGWSVVE